MHRSTVTKVKSSASKSFRSSVAEHVDVLTPVADVALKSGCSIDHFVYAAKLAFVRAAQVSARRNVSRISAITGLTRKEVAAFLEPEVSSEWIEANQAPVRRVIEGWLTDRQFSSAGRPRQLAKHGPGSTFEALVRKFGGDVTPVSVLRALKEIGAVKTLSDGTVQLTSTRQRPWPTSVDAKAFSSSAAEFINMLRSKDAPNPTGLYLRQEMSVPDELVASLRLACRDRGESLLEAIAQWLEASERRRPTKTTKRQIAIGIYLADQQQAT